MKRLWQKIRYAFSSEVYPRELPEKQYLTDAERKVIMMTAEGNVYLSMGALCTVEEVLDTKRKVIEYVRSRS